MMTYTFILKGIEKMDFPKKITKRPEDLIRKLCRYKIHYVRCNYSDNTFVKLMMVDDLTNCVEKKTNIRLDLHSAYLRWTSCNPAKKLR